MLDQSIAEGQQRILLLPADDLDTDLVGLDIAESEYTQEQYDIVLQ